MSRRAPTLVALVIGLAVPASGCTVKAPPAEPPAATLSRPPAPAPQSTPMRYSRESCRQVRSGHWWCPMAITDFEALAPDMQRTIRAAGWPRAIYERIPSKDDPRLFQVFHYPGGRVLFEDGRLVGARDAAGRVHEQDF
jgi:hypothetical protein